MSFNPYAPLFPTTPPFVQPSPAAAQSAATAPGADPYESYQRFMETPLGQQFNKNAENAAAYARQQADAQMANAKQELNLKVATLKQQGRNAEAQIALQKGDQQISRDRLAQELKIHQDTFGLQQQQFGLSRAEAYTQYASTPDRRFLAADFADAMDRLGQGLGVRPYGTTAGTPTPKTWDDFTALSASPGAPSTTGAGGSSMLGSGQVGASGDGSSQAVPQGGGTSGSTTDPRITASTAVMKAIPPSDSAGHDISDQAALTAIQNIYKAGRPGTYERMLPGQQQQFGAGLARLGYNAPDALAQMKRQGIGQGAANSW